MAKEASSIEEEEIGEGGTEVGEDRNTECGQHDWQEHGVGGHNGGEESISSVCKRQDGKGRSPGRLQMGTSSFTMVLMEREWSRNSAGQGAQEKCAGSEQGVRPNYVDEDRDL